MLIPKIPENQSMQLAKACLSSGMTYGQSFEQLYLISSNREVKTCRQPDASR